MQGLEKMNYSNAVIIIRQTLTRKNLRTEILIDRPTIC